jgi:RNA recognition motif. (a.k.a. RRM, RBD, or RNP domain)
MTNGFTLYFLPTPTMSDEPVAKKIRLDTSANEVSTSNAIVTDEASTAPLITSDNAPATADVEMNIEESVPPSTEEIAIIEKEVVAVAQEATPSATPAPEGDEEIIFKLRVGNLGKFIQTTQVKKLLSSYDIIFKNAKTAPKWDFAIVTFQSRSDLDAAVTALNGKVYKKQTIETAILKEESIKSRSDARQKDMNKRDAEDTRTAAERIADQVTPLWKLSYPEQLAKKSHKIREQMFDFTKRLLKFIPRQQMKKKVVEAAVAEPKVPVAESTSNAPAVTEPLSAVDEVSTKEAPAIVADAAEATLVVESVGVAEENRENTTAPEAVETSNPTEIITDSTTESKKVAAEPVAEPVKELTTTDRVPFTIEQIKEMDTDERAIVQLSWLQSAKVENGGLACPLMSIVPSPVNQTNTDNRRVQEQMRVHLRQRR